MTPPPASAIARQSARFAGEAGGGVSDAKALAYHRFRLFFFFFGLHVHGLALAFLVVSRVSHRLYAWPGGLEPAGLQNSAYIGLLFVTLTAVSFPVDLFSGYFLEKSFGLSKQTLSAWLWDFFKRALLSLGLFWVTAVFFLEAVRRSPESWWILLAGGWFILSAALATVFPAWILPLFYRTRPLADDTLRKELQEWCRTLGFPAMDVREIDFSKKTVKANAALTGFGRTRRVLLADTLLNGFTREEIRMVLSHEIGHHVRRHLLKGLLVDLAAASAAFYLLFLASPALARWAGVESLGDARALPLLSLLAAVAGFLWMPLRNTLSRRHEREADLHAWKTFPSEPVFVSTMNKLAKTNLSHRTPARWEEVLLASHPSIERRIASARGFFSRHLAN